MSTTSSSGPSQDRAVVAAEEVGVPRRRRVLMGVAIVLTVLAVAGLGFVAGTAVMPPEGEVVERATSQTYEVREGTVSRLISLSVVAETEITVIARAGSAGTVTEVVTNVPTTTAAGEVLLRIDERPVFAVAGAVPFYRDLQSGDVGRDVEQLHRFLADAGHAVGREARRFDATTSASVRQWRRDVGLLDGRRVELGTLVAVGELPASLLVMPEIELGGRVSEGQDLVARVGSEPRFHLPLREGQLDLVPIDADVLIAAGETTWRARTGRAVETDDGIQVELSAPGGGTPCGDVCAEWLAPLGETIMPAQVVVVPETSGPVVPIAAVGTRADGATFVELTSGEHLEVEVVAAADGLAVVAGVDVGTAIVLRTSP